MKIKEQVIDRDIYTLSDRISKKYQVLTWGIVFSIIGIIAAVLYYKFEIFSTNLVLMEITMGVVFVGLLALLIIVCYYLFGDNCVPYYKPTNEVLEREELFFDQNKEPLVCQNVNNGDFKALDEISKSITPQIVVVKYFNSNPQTNVVAAQAFRNDNGDMLPITKMLLFENK